MNMAVHPHTSKDGIFRLYMDYTKTEEWIAQNRERIAVAAYYKAKERGFKPGYEVQDWAEAREEIARMSIPHEFFV